MDINLDRLRYLSDIMPTNVITIFCEPHAVERYALWADLVIGSVLIPGAKAPLLITRELLGKMKRSDFSPMLSGVRSPQKSTEFSHCPFRPGCYTPHSPNEKD